MSSRNDYLPYQSTLVKRWNSAPRFLSRKKITNFNLTVSDLIFSAQNKTGLSDFGNSSFLTALEKLVDSINKNSELHQFGKLYTEQMIIKLLSQRLEVENYIKKKPEVLESKIDKPVIILGLPRTGTTFLFNCLSKDRKFRYLTNWEATLSQLPKQNKFGLKLQGSLLLKLQNYLAPNLKFIHNFKLNGPEECTPILMQGFTSLGFESFFKIPEYSKWLAQTSHYENYLYHKKVLQLLQFQTQEKQWLLKSPCHLEGIEDLASVYSNSLIIHTHRCPLETVASYASLCLAFKNITSRSIDLNEVGEHALQTLSFKMDKYLKTRSNLSNINIIDVSYNELINSPSKIILDIYQRFNLNFSDEMKINLQKYLSQKRESKQNHIYSLEYFGIDPYQVTNLFHSYISRFNKFLSQVSKD